MMRQNGNSESPARAVARNMKELSHDAITLAELQGQLLVTEVRQWRQSITLPAVLMGVAALIALGSVPVLLLSLASALVEFGQMSQSLSRLLAAMAGMIVAGFIAVVGRRKLSSASLKLERSREEFQRNLRWIKRVLKNKAHCPEPAAAVRRSST
jgi:hypothetical protein